MPTILKTKEEIYAAFPKVFPQASLHFGDGWNNIVWDACKYLQATFDTNQAWQSANYCQFSIIDSKEKFGGLRITVGWPDEVPPIERTENQTSNMQNWCKKDQAVFDFTEYRSRWTCEVTGEPGNPVRINGWLKTLSPEEDKKREQQPNV